MKMTNDLEKKAQEIKEQMDEMEYGILMIVLRPNYMIYIENNRINLVHNSQATFSWDARNISGMYRNFRQFQEDGFELEVLSEIYVNVPYKAIEYVEWLRDLPECSYLA